MDAPESTPQPRSETSGMWLVGSILLALLFATSGHSLINNRAKSGWLLVGVSALWSYLAYIEWRVRRKSVDHTLL